MTPIGPAGGATLRFLASVLDARAVAEAGAYAGGHHHHDHAHAHA